MCTPSPCLNTYKGYSLIKSSADSELTELHHYYCEKYEEEEEKSQFRMFRVHENDSSSHKNIA